MGFFQRNFPLVLLAVLLFLAWDPFGLFWTR